MISNSLRQHIIELLKNETGTAASSVKLQPVGGGSINDTYKIETDNGHLFFCKINSAVQFPGLFEAERQGLELLKRQQVIRIPSVIACTVTDDTQILVLEWIEQGSRTSSFWQLFGEQLAQLHDVKEKTFGLDADNYMGALVQTNTRAESWTEFFIHQRLEPQIRMALDAGLLKPKEAAVFERLYPRLHDIFPLTEPSLLHGDLWSGNYLCDRRGRPVLIDPAVYFGHPAIDLGMTTLFGGFDPLFFESYKACRPFPPNYHEQWEVCNLYPLLIHLNLFGESYKSSILRTIQRY